MRLLKGMLIIVFVLSSAHAAMLDVTRTAILVDDTNGDDPIKLKQAFAQILANNTGEDILTILQNPMFIEANVVSGINRSYFEKVDSQYLPATSQNYYWFHLIMQEQYIDNVIKQAQFSLLPHNKKPIMLWMVQEDTQRSADDVDESGSVVSEGLDAPLIVDYVQQDEIQMYWLQQWASVLALDIVMPTLDEGDQFAVKPESIKSLSFEAIEHSKNRYQLDQILMVYVKKTEQGIKLRSGLVIQDQDLHIKHFQQPSMAEAGVFYSLMEDVAQQYAQQFKINNDQLQKSTVKMVFDNINNYDEIHDIQQYLNQLSVVDSTSVVSASLGRLVINADIIINRQQLLKIIKNDQYLMVVDNGSFNLLQFRLLQ